MATWRTTLGAALIAGAFCILPVTPAVALTDDEIRQKIIEQDILAYPGNCPCPYNHASKNKHLDNRSRRETKAGDVYTIYSLD
jgi:hypothetical protein